MDGIARALNKGDIKEVCRIVLDVQILAGEIQVRALKITEAVKRLEDMRCPDTSCTVYDEEEKSGCGLDPLLRADCKTWKEEVKNGDSGSTPDKGQALSLQGNYQVD